MTILISALIILTCILLIIIVLIQNPKGGGLSSSFGGSGTQLFGGVKKTTDFLDRGTWTLSIVLVVLVLAANVLFTPSQEEGEQAPEVINTEVSAPAPIVAPSPVQGGEIEQGLIPEDVNEEENENP